MLTPLLLTGLTIPACSGPRQMSYVDLPAARDSATADVSVWPAVYTILLGELPAVMQAAWGGDPNDPPIGIVLTRQIRNSDEDRPLINHPRAWLDSLTRTGAIVSSRDIGKPVQGVDQAIFTVTLGRPKLLTADTVSVEVEFELQVISANRGARRFGQLRQPKLTREASSWKVADWGIPVWSQ